METLAPAGSAIPCNPAWGALHVLLNGLRLRTSSEWPYQGLLVWPELRTRASSPDLRGVAAHHMSDTEPQASVPSRAAAVAQSSNEGLVSLQVLLRASVIFAVERTDPILDRRAISSQHCQPVWRTGYETNPVELRDFTAKQGLP